MRFAAITLAALTVVCTGCSHLGYAGQAETLEPDALAQEPGWLAVQGVPVLHQAHEHDCGITALQMVLAHYGRSVPSELQAAHSVSTRWSAGELEDVAQAAGFAAYVVPGEIADLVHELRQGRPVVVGTAKPTVTGEAVAHYEVVVGIHPDRQRVATLDPAVGMQQNSYEGFLQEWVSTGSVLLVLIPKAGSPGAAADLRTAKR